MRRVLIGGFALGVVGLVALDTLAARFGLVQGITPRIDGSAPWIASRALGITAFASLTIEVLFGLSSSSGVADRWIGRARAIDLHSWLSSITLSLVAVHVLVLSLDTYAHFDLFDLAIPFVASKRRLGVAIGILATYLAIAIHVSSVFRKRIGASVWRKLHYGAFAVFIATVAHILVAGSDSGTTGMRIAVGFAASAVAGLTGLRVVKRFRPAAKARRNRPSTTG